MVVVVFFFFFQAEDGIRDFHVTGVQTCALPISCSGWSLPPSAIPSTVFTRRPSHARPSTRQESTGVPSTSTVQVPHSPSSQTCFVPVSPKSSRTTSSSVLGGAKATSTGSPFSSSAIFALAPGIFRKLILIRRRGRASFWASKAASGVHHGGQADGRTGGRKDGGLADGRTGGRKSGARAVGLSVRPSACPPVRPRLPRAGPANPEDRPAHRRSQRHPRRDPRARRTRLGGLRGVAAEADDRHPEAAGRRRRRAVLGGVRPGHRDGFRAAPGRVRA